MQVLIKGTENIFPAIEKAIYRLGYRHIYLKQKENSGFLEAVSLPKGWRGEAVPMPIDVLENGLRFQVDVESGQKTGFFIDQRDNRELTRQWSAGKTVLNAFSYTGGFSLYALAGGAREVHSVDISKDAIEKAKALVELNFPGANHQAMAEDCFDYLRRCETQYDLIVLDPPAFAKNAKSVPNAARGYKDLNLLAMKNPSREACSLPVVRKTLRLIYPATRVWGSRCRPRVHFAVFVAGRRCHQHLPP